jgi:Mor family transcriptional regulator
MTTTPTRDPHPALTGLLAENPDIVDRIFEYLLEQIPAIAEVAPDIDKAKAGIREELGGESHWVRTGRAAEQAAKGREVLRLFNGRNAAEVARSLGISKSTVYRRIKQPGA